MRRLVRILFGVGAFYLYVITIAVVWLLWTARSQEQVVAGDTLLKKFLDQNGLNLLGDTMSGILAPVTLVVIVATLFVQQMQMETTVKEMKEQNQLSREIANANYKLAMHETRLKAYRHFQEAREIYITSEGSDIGVIDALENSLREAEFVYDADMNYMLFELAEELNRLHGLKQVIDGKIFQKEHGNLLKEAFAELDQQQDEYTERSRKVFARLESEELRQRFTKPLRLADSIGDPVTATNQRTA